MRLHWTTPNNPINVGGGCAAAICALLAFSTVATSAESCEKLTELQCINSADCTLHQRGARGSHYSCEAAANACERGFKQKSGTQADCESKTGCIFVPQSCYCAPDVICRCGGGPPSQCHPEIVATLGNEEAPFGSDCWVPGEPGENILPPCDPSVTPSMRAAPVSATAFDTDEIERIPRWWEFWKPGWSLWAD
jgi:hypothetical protein